jgi:hypothetical protein
MGSVWYEEVGAIVRAIDCTMWIVLTCRCKKVTWADGIMLFNCVHVFLPVVTNVHYTRILKCISSCEYYGV